MKRGRKADFRLCPAAKIDKTSTLLCRRRQRAEPVGSVSVSDAIHVKPPPSGSAVKTVSPTISVRPRPRPRVGGDSLIVWKERKSRFWIVTTQRLILSLLPKVSRNRGELICYSRAPSWSSLLINGTQHFLPSPQTGHNT